MAYPLTIDGTYNVRDLGGFPIESGGVTRKHVLVRAGNLDKLPTGSQKQLVTYGLKTVIDLRDESEAPLVTSNAIRAKIDAILPELPLADAGRVVLCCQSGQSAKI